MQSGFGVSTGAALQIDTTPEGIYSGIRTLLEMSDAERLSMGQRGLTLVKECYTWPKVARQMREVYDWMLNGSSAQAHVEFN